MNEIIKKIIIRKKNGTDCTEQESAEVKGYLKKLLINAKHGKLYMHDKVAIIADIEQYFPQEYGESLFEVGKFA